MNEHRSLSTIEQLPNELFFQIFQYINARDLHHGWSKLNNRFTAILHSVPMHAHLKEQNDYKIYESCFRYYASQFIYIRIEPRCDILETLNVNHFLNIRSLHLSTVTDKQYDQIIPDHMPDLTHLTINRIEALWKPVSLLFGPKQFVHLKTCRLPCFYTTTANLQPCLTLRSLHLKFCFRKMFFEQVKVLLPNLVHFESVLEESCTSNGFIPNIPSLLIPYNNLRHLKVELHRNITHDFLPLLLTVVPELRYLELYFQDGCDYRQIADLLQTKLPRLKHFNLIANLKGYLPLPNIDVIKEMSSWFADMKLEPYGNIERIICNVKK